ncbi:UNVERIFIED_CONTAM: hypothetical protein NCL1_44530 [Trichonephila clavipes]
MKNMIENWVTNIETLRSTVLRRKTDFFPEEDTAMPYLGFKPTRLQAESYSHHTGWVTVNESFPHSLNVKQ